MRIVCFLLCQWFAANAWAESAILSQWLELGQDNHWIARVVTTSEHCPVIKTPQTDITMAVRAPPNKPFPVTICQALLPPDTISASIKGGKAFHLPKAEPQKIVIIGDTGCVLEEGVPAQNCRSAAHWPFPLIAKHAAAFKPDLVIHVGDYYYRQTYGDSWAAWQADFFKPAAPLLQKAPWIFVRGNHEICERGGQGWTKLLDPFSFKHCFNHSPIYSVNIGDTRLFIMDSANASDLTAPAEQVSWYENYLRAVVQSPSKYNWLITHKPFWMVFKDDTLTQTYQANVTNTLETAWLNIAPPNVNLLISGHLHRFQTINFDASRPAQIIVGASGARLEKSLARTDLSGLSLASKPISSGLSLTRFGYMTLEKEKNKDGWRAQIRNPYGRVLAHCVLHENQFICKERK